MSSGVSKKSDGGRGRAGARILRHPSGSYALTGSRRGEVLGAGRDLLRTLASHPWAVARTEARLALEMGRIAAGRSQRLADAQDGRFTHPAWRENPLFRRAMQGYLAWSGALFELVHSLRLAPADKRRLLLVTEQLVAAGAPTNFFFTHPGFYENAVKTRGRSIMTGLRHLLEDVYGNGGLPSQVDTGAFRLGRNIAATEGAVVFRDEMFELIQYSPRTPAVDSRPVLFCPPQINKYYLIDLAPDNSFVRHALEAGQQMFTISWRNPTATQQHWNLAAYVSATCKAIDIVGQICGSAPLKLAGAWVGGLTAALALARLAAEGKQSRVACLALFAAVLDMARPSRLGRLADQAAVASALARSRKRGVVEGHDMARILAWMKSDQLIWYFVVNNYVLGNAPPASDALYWNNDTPRLPAALHADLLRLHMDNPLPQAGRIMLDGIDIDIGAIGCDVFVVAADRDSIVPWQACYRSMQLFGANMRFVLVDAGHISSLLIPPCDDNTCYYVNDDYTQDPVAWQRAARIQAGSWWPAWIRWCEAHGGDQRPAPQSYGNDMFEPIDAAPGRYVRQR